MVDLNTLEKLKAISDKEWGRIYKELTLYSALKLNRFGFEVRTEKDSVDAQHFATLAIEKLFDGSRTWDSDRFPDLLIHLKGIVKSLLSSHFKSSKRSIVSTQKDYQLESSCETEEEIFTAIYNDIEVYDSSPEEIMISNEKWLEMETLFGENDEAYLIFSEWLEGKPPRQIAEDYSQNVTDIYSIVRKGKQIIKSLYKN